MRTLTFLVCCGLAFGLSTQSLQAKTYKIQFNRIHKVGQIYTYKASGTFLNHVKVMVGKRAIRNRKEDIQLSYRAKVMVLAVSKNQQSRKETHLIQRFLKMSGIKKAAVLPKGTIVQVEMVGNKASFTIKGKPAPKKVAVLLDRVITMKKSKDPLDDDILGTNKPQKVGASWPINVALAAASMKSPKLSVDTKDMSGQTTLVKAGEVNGVKGLHFKVKMNIKALQIPLPPVFKVSKSKMLIRLSGFFPTNRNLGRLVSTKLMKMNFMAQGQTPQGLVRMDIKVRFTLKTHRKYLKK